MATVKVDVEYCNKCGFADKYNELSNYIIEKHPNIQINGREGRRGSFEVQINEQLVHSKLNTLAYPNFEDLAQIVAEVEKGGTPRQCKQEKITDCILC